jgi:DNA topoisomerase-3
MAKNILITEKPSVAMEFAKVLGINGARKDGYLESDKWIVTWCVGHLITMSYPEVYDEKLKFWRLDTLPFMPKEYKYEIIPAVEKQFNTVKSLLVRDDVDTIYVATDSGREGEYIYRLVEQMANVKGKARKRVWIDSQTEEEIKRGIAEAKDLEEYNSLSDSAYLRAKEDYLIGINFSRLLTIIFGRRAASKLNEDRISISVGRVMTCVLGMIVSREREIRNFVKTTYYKIAGEFGDEQNYLKAEWKVTEKSKMYNSPKLYNETGFKKIEDAREFITSLKDKKAIVTEVKKSKQKENAPLLFNLAEIQNECTKRFKIKPDETLDVIQTLYEKKLVTYPRTDARVLSTAVAKVISKNLNGIAKGYKDDEVQGYIKKMVSEKDLCELVRINGPVFDDKKEAVLLNSSFFVHTSRFEGMPMSVLDALSYGVPCLVTQGSNLREEIEQCNAGWGADNSVESIESALLCLCEDIPNLSQMQINAKKLSEKYTWDEIGKSNHLIYKDLLKC